MNAFVNAFFLVYKEFAAFSLRLLQKNEGEIFNDFMSKRS